MTLDKPIVPCFHECLWDRREISTLKRFTSARPVGSDYRTKKASSCVMGYVTTQLTKHEIDESPFIHWNKIKDQSRCWLRFQNRILHRQNGGEQELFAVLDVRTSTRTKGAKEINEEWKKKSSSSNVIKTFIVDQLTTDSTEILKMCYTQTKALFTVWQTLSFQSREQGKSSFGWKKRRINGRNLAILFQIQSKPLFSSQERKEKEKAVDLDFALVV